MKNHKMLIALITAAVLLMTGFVFAEEISREEGGFFGGMRGHHRRMAEGQDWDREDFPREGFRFGGAHCFFFGEEGDVEEYREQWLETRIDAVEEALEAGEITEEEAMEYKEFLQERSRSFEEGDFHRGPGGGRGRNRGHMW